MFILYAGFDASQTARTTGDIKRRGGALVALGPRLTFQASSKSLGRIT